MSQASDHDPDDRVHRPKRYQPQDLKRFRLTVDWVKKGEPTTAEATLIDLSVGGVKLSLGSQLTLQQAVSLTIAAPDAGLNLAVPAKICWLRPTMSERWTVGCAFVPELPSSTLEDFFASGLLERRTFAREPLTLAARAQWELDPCRFDVELQDASKGGICIRSPRSGDVGTRLMVYVADPEGQETRIAVKVQWQAATGDDFLIGCVYFSVEGWPAIQRRLATIKAASGPIVRGSRWWARKSTQSPE